MIKKLKKYLKKRKYEKYGIWDTFHPINIKGKEFYGTTSSGPSGGDVYG